MKIHVKLFASLRKYAPAGSAEGGLVVELPDGAAVGDVIAQLGIPSEHARMVVSRNAQLELTTPLQDGQEIDVFPPLAGG